MIGGTMGILDGGLRRNFETFCENWGVEPGELDGDLYLKMIELYYKEISLRMVSNPPIVKVQNGVFPSPKG